MEEERMKRMKIAVLVVMIALLVVTIPLTYNSFYTEEKKYQPIETEIEKAIKVKQLENKFETFEHMGLGDAGAGGMEAPTIECLDAEQFIRLVPENETIYVSLELKKSETCSCKHLLEKKYWAFTENRAGVMEYTRTYQNHWENHKYWRLESYHSNLVEFKWNNLESVVILIIMFDAIILITGWITARSIENKYRWKTWNPFY